MTTALIIIIIIMVVAMMTTGMMTTMMMMMFEGSSLSRKRNVTFLLRRVDVLNGGGCRGRIIFRPHNGGRIAMALEEDSDICSYHVLHDGGVACRLVFRVDQHIDGLSTGVEGRRRDIQLDF